MPGLTENDLQFARAAGYKIPWAAGLVAVDPLTFSSVLCILGAVSQIWFP